ncbi:hypothetical protein H6P81_017442 [Aristolochia fimbriata]|uniref:Cytochrome P450 n=1 Tax=Aristolochia fimbriata TaxID=158543 RepID=A0AAV7E2G9_ARIFI|nr:hypothetical protein H6P81_017442 [Aristolochia fimbriata]
MEINLEEMDSFVVALVFPILVLWILWRLLNTGLQREKLPPGPVPMPLIGSLFKLAGDDHPHRTLAGLAVTYGPLMSLRLGQVTAVVVSSATAAKEVLQKHDQSFAGRAVVDAIRCQGHEHASVVWLPPDQRWRRLRSLCNTFIFSSQRLDASQGVRRRKVAELLAHVDGCAALGKGVDVGKVAFTTFLNLISNTIFSVDMVYDVDSKTAGEFKALVDEIMEEVGKPNVVDAFPILRRINPQGIRRKVTSSFAKLHEIFEKKIEEREASRSSSTPDYRQRNDFLGALLDQRENGVELSRFELKTLFLDLFIAGSDTNSVTIEWVMTELLRNPESMAQARTELEEVMGERKEVEESDIAQLPYLQAIVKETLRLIARDDELWENPELFNPKRFLGTSSNVDYRGRHFELIPFGAGRRRCPGLPLAYRMVHLMLASLLHSFIWSLPEADRELIWEKGSECHSRSPSL